MAVSLFFRDFGGAGLPPLILLHGLLGSSRNWQTTGADLTSKHHVFALDLRNHGRSPHDPEMSYPAMVSDVLTWMDSNGFAEATLMGHSMGGKVAMLLACRHPERVRRLIVVDIAPKNYLSTAHRGEFAAMNELDLRGLTSRGEAEMRFEARVPDWAMRKFLTTNLDRADDGSWRWAVNLPVLTETLPELERSSLDEGDRFAGPTHFITGGKSGYVHTDDWPRIIRHFPEARLTVIADSGHNPHMETRADFVRAALGEG